MIENLAKSNGIDEESARKRSCDSFGAETLLVAPLSSWLKTRDAIHEDIFENFWSEQLNSFVQAKGSETLDASGTSDAAHALHQSHRAALDFDDGSWRRTSHRGRAGLSLQ